MCSTYVTAIVIKYLVRWLSLLENKKRVCLDLDYKIFKFSSFLLFFGGREKEREGSKEREFNLCVLILGLKSLKAVMDEVPRDLDSLTFSFKIDTVTQILSNKKQLLISLSYWWLGMSQNTDTSCADGREDNYYPPETPMTLGMHTSPWTPMLFCFPADVKALNNSFCFMEFKIKSFH